MPIHRIHNLRLCKEDDVRSKRYGQCIKNLRFLIDQKLCFWCMRFFCFTTKGIFSWKQQHACAKRMIVTDAPANIAFKGYEHRCGYITFGYVRDVVSLLCQAKSSKGWPWFPAGKQLFPFGKPWRPNSVKEGILTS